MSDCTFDLADPPHGAPAGGARLPLSPAPIAPLWVAELDEGLMRQSEYQWQPLSPSDGSSSPQSLSSQGHLFTYDQFDATSVVRAVDHGNCRTPPPTSPRASGPGPYQEIPAQYGARPDLYASFNRVTGAASPPAAPASQQLLGGSNGTTPMHVSSTANSCNANLTAFAFSSQSPDVYGDAHLFHLSTTTHSARLTRDAQYTYWPLEATQNVTNWNNSFSGRRSDCARNLAFDNSSAKSLVS
jgi:hypothetical protein